jgi:hypothetical protein
MIQVTMYSETAKAKISGDNDEFQRDLLRLTRAIPASSREFIPSLKCWVISNPHRYTCVPEIKAALEDSERQPLLF